MQSSSRVSNAHVRNPACFICQQLAAADSMLLETDHWMACLTPEQGYLGRSIILLKDHKNSLSKLSPDEWIDLRAVIQMFERGGRRAFEPQVFNWACLMNTAFKSPVPTPHVHWIVRPRYDHSVTIQGTIFTDPNFASHYDKTHDRANVAPAQSQLRAEIERRLKDHF